MPPAMRQRVSVIPIKLATKTPSTEQRIFTFSFPRSLQIPELLGKFVLSAISSEKQI